MATPLSRTPVESVRRVHLFAYLVALLALAWGIDLVETVASEGATAYTVGLALVVCSTLGATVVLVRTPENLRRGTDPAPVYLWALAAVSTAAFGGLVAGRVLLG